MLDIQDVSVHLNHKTIVDGVSLRVDENDFFMLVGPNGAGKSTLIKAIMRIHKYRGRVLLNGRDILSIRPKALASMIGVLAQEHQPQFPHTVYEVVSLGRYAHMKGMFGALGREDREMIQKALAMTGLDRMADQSVLTLSGGELQRVFLAQVLAQDPSLLILDEPANHLDIKYQITLFDIIREWSKAPGKAVLAVVHDLNTALCYGTRALLMHQGKAYAQGEVRQVLNRENLKAIYSVDVAQWMTDLLKQWT
ncbi:MAG TPA: ABC transporter ATP-binding protein [Thermoclostridium caenicola]|uniref:ABC transporter ATP-binding protein n=1 Tax=Thermoclostridium caenicola TaxID=659425 RepID=UPI002BE9697A|nr:ABC transporter ATP-binding protein [Thermoclostridium caenicola]HOK42444.1 ABC transporter ATP-binding protein [Thermoclostridium caenicola]HOL84774.1 ABC transporter ATP-binding protein [Thermoclostridium caenicola]HPO76964.1 ABC transporter ATP-binding protein [Thermoclostridium caenicola]